MAEASNQRPIIIKRKKGGGHAGHHGGAWKVAYADFVTAMMAFFLLMWLLNVTTAVQKNGIADYFTPASLSASTSGAGGLLGGTAMSKDGASTAKNSPTVTSMSSPTSPGFAARPNDDEEEDTQSNAPRDPDQKPSDEDMKAAQEELAHKEEAQFKEAEQTLRNAIEAVPELRSLNANLLIDQTPEGMRIQIVDGEKQSMFPLGGKDMYPHTQQILTLVGQAVSKMANKISISGHTDSTPYNKGKSAVYDNWELSSDRANASRRVLVSNGIDEARIATVVGRADREPLVPDNTASPTNRRISIVLLRTTKLSATGPLNVNGPAR